MADQLTQMKVFATVVNHKSFTAAARALTMSNSAVTKHIQQLETHLGICLLHRNTRKFALTKMGETFFRDCIEILNEVATSEANVRESSHDASGTIRVNAPLDLALTGLTRRLDDFYSHLPDTSLRLFLNNAFLDTIDGGYDVTIRISKDLPQTNWHIHRIGNIERKLIISPELLENQAPITTPDDLGRFECLSYGHSNKSEVWTFAGNSIASPCTKKADGQFHSNNGLALLAAVSAGHGIALLPNFIVRSALEKGDVIEIDVGLQVAPLLLYALCPLNPHVPEKVTKFLDFLQNSYDEARKARQL